MSNPNMANLPPKPSTGMKTLAIYPCHTFISCYFRLIFNLIDAPTSPNQQQSLVHRQPDFAHSQTNLPPNQSHLVRHQPSFAQTQPNVSLNQPPNFAHRQPSFARLSQPTNFPHNQPHLAQPQPGFAHRQPNGPSPSDVPPHGQQQHFSPANQIVLRGHPQSLDQSLISTNSYYFPASSHQSFSPSNYQRFLAQASRPAHSNHPHFSYQHQHQQHHHHSRTSSQESLQTCNPALLMRVPQTVPAGGANNRRVTISTSAAADAAARRQEGGMQNNFTPANNDDDGGPSSFYSNREIHNAIRQVHETVNIMRNEMVAMHDQVHQNIYTLHRETHAMHGRNTDSIERVIKMLNYS